MVKQFLEKNRLKMNFKEEFNEWCEDFSQQDGIDKFDSVMDVFFVFFIIVMGLFFLTIFVMLAPLVTLIVVSFFMIGSLIFLALDKYGKNITKKKEELK